MKTIWKFPLVIADEQYVRMPHGAEVLTVQEQNGMVQAWAIVDSAHQETESVRFSLRGTGHELGIVGRHVGTFQLHDGALVFHAFVAYEYTRITR